jgi:hypothetical protein
VNRELGDSHLVIWFNVKKAREHLLTRGSVYTLRPRLRSEGNDVLSYGRFGAKGYVKVELVKVIRSREELQPYVSESGFRSADEWLNQTEEMYGTTGDAWLSAGRPLYKATLAWLV